MKSAKIIIFLILFLLAVFGSSFILPKFFTISSDFKQEFNRLYLENQSLKAQLESGLAVEIPAENFKVAKVYSSYPFNNRHEISIAAGKRDGLKELSPVVIDDAILIGQISRVYENYSLVRTIFDSDWRLSVKIGKSGIDALLVGGPEPRLTMIDKNKPVKEEEVVYSASSGFPYGVLIGRVKRVISSPTAVFQEAELSLSYGLDNKITEVRVLTGYGH